MGKTAFDLSANSASVVNRCKVSFEKKHTQFDCGRYVVGYTHNPKGKIIYIFLIDKEVLKIKLKKKK